MEIKVQSPRIPMRAVLKMSSGEAKMLRVVINEWASRAASGTYENQVRERCLWLDIQDQIAPDTKLLVVTPRIKDDKYCSVAYQP